MKLELVLQPRVNDGSFSLCYIRHVGPEYKFKAKLWSYNGDAPWHFITLPKEYSKEIEMLTPPESKKAFGSLKVTARAGNTSWKTSIFPDTKSKSYVLPVKKNIRQKLGVQEGDSIEITITLSDI